MKHKRIISILSAFMLCVMPILQPLTVYAENSAEAYPYTLFAASEEEGAITSTAGNFCVNGSVATNGTIVASGNFNVNGTKLEHAGEKMIYISGKIETQYFSGSNVNEIPEDFVLEETNININEATEVNGDVALTGNININNAFMAVGDIVFDGDVKNSNNSVIYSKYGSIVIDSQNVNLNGLVYAPFGDVVVKGQNLNLNSVIIIANKITFDCPNVNANTSNEMAKFVGNVSEKFNIPYAEWEYLPDSDGDGIPDFINDFANWEYLMDTDEDYLPDCIEEYLGTDLYNADTDGDGLPDGHEFFIVGTDYLIYDTLGEGMSDGEYDLDEDGLNNLKEYEIGTHPWEADCDSDLLTDGEEVTIHGTDPLKSDTDGEGLSDSDEIVLGTSPLIQDTDGDTIFDCDEKIMQEYVYETNQEDVYIEEVKITMNATGNVERTTRVEGMRGMDPLCEGVAGIIDEPFSIETDSEFDTATISFQFNLDSLGNKSVEDFIILWYDEENYKFVEMDTTYDVANGTISTETTHFSRYMVVDKIAWFEVWNEELNYTNTQYEKSAVYTVLAVDCSGSMGSSDPITSEPKSEGSSYYFNNCKRYEAVSNYIKAMDSDDKASIVMFDHSAYIQCAMTDDKIELTEVSEKFFNAGGTDFDNALTASIQILNDSEGSTRKKIVLLSDGESYVSDSVLQSAIESNIKIYTIGLGNSSDSVLQHIADATGGEFFKAYTADELLDIYEEIGVTVEIDTTDTDGDGLYDVYETAGMRLQNGNIIYTDPMKDDTDGDGLADGEEINPVMQHDEVYYPTGVPLEKDYFIMYSNPNEKDGDFDGYLDIDEIAGVLKEDGTRYEPSNPLISNVKHVEISNNYISIDTPNNLDEPNYYYGGSQMWFYDENNPDRNNTVSFQLEKGGCGVIASCDNLLYLQQYMGWNLTDVNTTGTTISYNEYDTFVREYAETYDMPSSVDYWCVTATQSIAMLPYSVSQSYYEQMGNIGYTFAMSITDGTGTMGVWADWLKNAINNYLWSSGYGDVGQYNRYFTQSYEPEVIANKIMMSLNRNIPVIFATNRNSTVKYQGVNVNSTNELGSHFVTITGINIDTISGEITLTISTWSFMAIVSLNEFYSEVQGGSRVVIFE